MKRLYILAFFFSLLFLSSFVSAIVYSVDLPTSGIEVDYVGDSKDLVARVTNDNAACNIACSWELTSGTGSVSTGVTGEIMNGDFKDIKFRVTSSGIAPKQFTFSIFCWDFAKTWPCNGELSKSDIFDMEFGYCGDGELYPSEEECDANNLNGQNCMTRGFDGGILSCSGCTFDSSDCYRCGDGEINSGEECDGSNLAGRTCGSLGYVGGVLGCSNSCQYDVSRCESKEDNFREEINTKISEVSEEISRVGETISEASEDDDWLTKTKLVLGIVVALGAIGGYTLKVYLWHKKRKKKKIRGKRRY